MRKLSYKNCPTERQTQVAVFRWAHVTNIPGTNEKIFDYLVASANGGSRNYLEAVNLKHQGVKAGFPDLGLYIKRGEYGGLFIEVKRQTAGVVSKKQNEWISRLRRQGYLACVARGFDEVIKTIVDYLNLATKTNEHRDA